MASLDDLLSSLWASGGPASGSSAPAQPQQSGGGSIFGLPGAILRGYQAAYAALPQRIQDEQTSRGLDVATKQAGLAFLLQRRNMLAQMLPQLMGQDGSGGQNADGPAPMPSMPGANMAGQMPQIAADPSAQPEGMPNAAPSLSGVTVTAPRAPGATPSSVIDRRRGALAGLAIMDDKAKDAWDIWKPDFAQGTDGTLYDKTSGARGQRLASPAFQNDRVIDMGDPSNVGQFFGKAPAPGAEPVYDRNGREAGWRLADGTIQAVQGASTADATGKNAGEAAFAGRIAGAREAAKAPYTPVQVNDGGTPTTITAAQLPSLAGGPRGGGGGGAPVTVPAQPAGSFPSPSIAARLPQQGAAPAMRSPAPATTPARAAGGFGIRGLPPQDAKFAEDQGADASKTISADVAARGEAMQAATNAKMALAYVQTHGNAANPTAPYLVAGANYLRSLSPSALQAIGVDPAKVSQYANDAGTYQRLSNQELLSFSKGNLPSRYTEREMAVAGKVIPNMTTAPDAASFHWGLEAATANKQVQKSDFSAGYNGPKTKQALEQAWASTPQGQSSLFQDPVWQNIQIGGKPAVIPFKHGNETWGAIGAGTGHPTFFKWVQ